ncbi:hypothetical protein Tco_1232186, partial [Tanacetum coccineum]
MVVVVKVEEEEEEGELLKYEYLDKARTAQTADPVRGLLKIARSQINKYNFGRRDMIELLLLLTMIEKLLNETSRVI